MRHVWLFAILFPELFLCAVLIEPAFLLLHRILLNKKIIKQEIYILRRVTIGRHDSDAH